MIEKESASRLRKKGRFYTTLDSEMVQTIKNPDSLAIWAYLQSQSEGYVVRANHLQNHFSLGATRYNSAMRLLKDIRLIKHEIIRNEKGHIVDRVIDCYSLPFESIDNSTIHPENRVYGSSIDSIDVSPNTPKNHGMDKTV